MMLGIVASSTVGGDVPVWQDGFAGAPGVTAQYPALLGSPYVTRPPWKVCGVDTDYGVGYAAAVVLKDPASDTLPDGAVYNGSLHTVRVDGSGVVLDGWDFSLHGGVQLDWETGANLSILNSNFKTGANSVSAIYVAVGVLPGPLTITNCVLDGNRHAQGTVDGLVEIKAAGVVLTMRYSWLKNAYLDIVQLAAAGGTPTIQYCILENNGWDSGFDPHADMVQVFGVGVWRSTINYNLFLVNVDTLTGSQGLFLHDNFFLPTFDFMDASQNTVVLSAAPGTGGISYFFIANTSQLNCTATMNNNYIDPTGIRFGVWNISYNPAYGPYHGTVERTGNINMLTGEPLNA